MKIDLLWASFTYYLLCSLHKVVICVKKLKILLRFKILKQLTFRFKVMQRTCKNAYKECCRLFTSKVTGMVGIRTGGY